jgi:hypothetical protein
MNLQQIVQPSWPPLRHIEAGWAELTAAEQLEVESRIAAVDCTVTGRREATLPFFAFLAQVETIAIEIPLRFLPHAPDELRPLLRRQLVDEVFHSLLFAKIAHELALPDAIPPQPSTAAEELLQLIRNENEWNAGVTLLNLAECWIENLFRHAAGWGVANDVFKTVLIDEARHVEEAFHGNCPEAVSALEEGLMKLFQEPHAALAMHELAGTESYVKMAQGLQTAHQGHLEKLGLKPGELWQEYAADLEMPDMELPTPIANRPWRMSASKLWHTPRDPTMQGDFDCPVGKVPKKLLTPFFVAAVGRAWAKNPELNRVYAKGRVWQLPRVNVGVRVLIDDQLATVVVTDADKRSVADIGHAIVDGVAQLQSVHREDDKPMDDELFGLMDPGPASFAVAISNPGKFGLVRGAGALSGHIAPSSDITIGKRRRLPVWKGVGYFPAWHVNFGCLQDHRVFDGKEAGIAMSSILAESRRVGKILRAKHTYIPPEFQMLPAVGKYVPMAIGAGIGIAAAGGALAVSALAKAGDEADAAFQSPEGTENSELEENE